MRSDDKLSLKDRVRHWTPSPVQAEAMRDADRSMDWLWQLSVEQLAPYAGQWIAVHDCRIVATAPTRAELMPKVSHLNRATVIVHRVENRWMIR